MTNRRVFCFDIDGVVATVEPDNQYDLADPQLDMIHVINTLYDLGHTIILFTARGSATGIDWRDITIRQMNSWGVKYHQLIFGKPAADYYIDDKSISFDQVREIVTEFQNAEAKRDETAV